jgi:hypothetical protein
MLGQGDNPIGTMLDDARHAEHLVLARTALRRSLSENAAWFWFTEWRLCLLSPKGRDELYACFGSERDQQALFDDSPAILQERRVNVDPSGAFHPRPWQCYPRPPPRWRPSRTTTLASCGWRRACIRSMGQYKHSGNEGQNLVILITNTQKRPQTGNDGAHSPANGVAGPSITPWFVRYSMSGCSLDLIV